MFDLSDSHSAAGAANEIGTWLDVACRAPRASARVVVLEVSTEDYEDWESEVVRRDPHAFTGELGGRGMCSAVVAPEGHRGSAWLAVQIREVR